MKNLALEMNYYKNASTANSLAYNDPQGRGSIFSHIARGSAGEERRAFAKSMWKNI